MNKDKTTEKKTFEERFNRYKTKRKAEHPEITVYTREEWQKKKAAEDSTAPSNEVNIDLVAEKLSCRIEELLSKLNAKAKH